MLPYENSLRRIDENHPAAVTSCSDTARSKQILISYVRAEAAEHALRLKHSLTGRGFDVFLVSCIILMILMFTVKISILTVVQLLS